MKKRHLLISFLLSATLAQAKAYKVVVRGDSPKPTTNTEVTITGSDSLIVTPSVNVNSITVSLKDAAGNVIEEHIAPAQAQSTLTLIAPDFPAGYFLEVRDSRGVVYQEFKYQ